MYFISAVCNQCFDIRGPLYHQIYSKRLATQKFNIGCQENFKTGSGKRNIRSLKMNKWSCFFSIKAKVKNMREVIYSLYVREKTRNTVEIES